MSSVLTWMYMAFVVLPLMCVYGCALVFVQVPVKVS